MKRFLLILLALVAFNGMVGYVAYRLAGPSLKCRVFPKSCK